MERTIVVQLHPTPEQARTLKETLEQHTACFNAVTREGFDTGCSNGVELHKRTYYPLRAQVSRPSCTTGVYCPCQSHGSRHVCAHLQGQEAEGVSQKG